MVGIELIYRCTKSCGENVSQGGGGGWGGVEVCFINRYEGNIPLSHTQDTARRHTNSQAQHTHHTQADSHIKFSLFKNIKFIYLLVLLFIILLLLLFVLIV